VHVGEHTFVIDCIKDHTLKSLLRWLPLVFNVGIRNKKQPYQQKPVFKHDFIVFHDGGDISVFEILDGFPVIGIASSIIVTIQNFVCDVYEGPENNLNVFARNQAAK